MRIPRVMGFQRAQLVSNAGQALHRNSYGILLPSD